MHEITSHPIAVSVDNMDIAGYIEVLPYPSEEEINDPEFQKLWNALQYFVLECDECDACVCTYNHIKLIMDMMNED
jgi:hypothetical protein